MSLPSHSGLYRVFACVWMHDAKTFTTSFDFGGCVVLALACIGILQISTLPGRGDSLMLQQLSNLMPCALCLMHIHCFADLR